MIEAVFDEYLVREYENKGGKILENAKIKNIDINETKQESAFSTKYYKYSLSIFVLIIIRTSFMNVLLFLKLTKVF